MMTMRSARVTRGLVAALTLALMPSPVVQAQGAPITAQSLIDRAEILDLLTRYYYHLGHGSADDFAIFYADDAELVLGTTSFKGRAAIEGAYKSTTDSPQRRAHAFNALLSNPLIMVQGDKATARIIYTEIVIDKDGDPPRILAQGREFDHLVKVAGQWRFSKRQIMTADKVPADWADGTN